MQQRYLYLVNFSDHLSPAPQELMYTINARVPGWQSVTNSRTWFLFTTQTPNLVTMAMQHDFQRFGYPANTYEILQYQLPAIGQRPTIIHQVPIRAY